jgi:hypothetical protein
LLDVGYVICGKGKGYVICAKTKAICGLLWCSDQIDSRTEVALGDLVGLARKIARDMMENSVGETMTTALCY